MGQQTCLLLPTTDPRWRQTQSLQKKAAGQKQAMSVALLQLLDISPQIRVAAVTALAAIAAVDSRGLSLSLSLSLCQCVCAWAKRRAAAMAARRGVQRDRPARGKPVAWRVVDDGKPGQRQKWWATHGQDGKAASGAGARGAKASGCDERGAGGQARPRPHSTPPCRPSLCTGMPNGLFVLADGTRLVSTTENTLQLLTPSGQLA